MRIKFKKEIGDKIFNKISEKRSYKSVCDELNISYNTFKHWRNSTYSMPLSVFNRLERIIPELVRFKNYSRIVDQNWGARKGGLSSIKRLTKRELKCSEFSTSL